MAETPDEPKGNNGLPEDFKWGSVPPGMEEAFEGLNSMRQESVPLHEIYLSHVAAGFTPGQALYLLAATIVNDPGSAPGDPLLST